MILYRVLLCHSRTPHVRIHDLLPPHKRLPLPRTFFTRDNIWVVCWHIFPDGAGKFGAGCEITKGMLQTHLLFSSILNSYSFMYPQAAGAFNFALCIPIWHIFIAQILDAVDFPIALPVGDLSTLIIGKNQKARKREVDG